jgi:hypothetical protein
MTALIAKAAVHAVKPQGLQWVEQRHPRWAVIGHLQPFASEPSRTLKRPFRTDSGPSPISGRFIGRLPAYLYTTTEKCATRIKVGQQCVPWDQGPLSRRFFENLPSTRPARKTVARTTAPTHETADDAVDSG